LQGDFPDGPERREQGAPVTVFHFDAQGQFPAHARFGYLQVVDFRPPLAVRDFVFRIRQGGAPGHEFYRAGLRAQENGIMAAVREHSLAAHCHGQGLPGCAACHGSLHARGIARAQHPGPGKVRRHGSGHLWQETAAAGQDHQIDLPGLQSGAADGIVQRPKDRAGHPIFLLPGVEDVLVQKGREQVLELAQTDTRVPELDGQAVVEQQGRVGVGKDALQLHDRVGRLAMARAAELFQLLGQVEEGVGQEMTLVVEVQLAGVEAVLFEQLRNDHLVQNGQVNVAAAQPVVARDCQRGQSGRDAGNQRCRRCRPAR